MSASREKKQRQGAEPSQKELQAQQKQAEQKRKVRLYTTIGVVIVVLVAALLIWNSGFFQRRTTAATVGSTNVSTAELSYYYANARMSEFYYYSLLGYTIPADSDVMDATTGQTWREYFLEQALDNALEYTAIYNAAVADGYSLSMVKSDLDTAIANTKTQATANGYSYAAYLRAMYGNYMTTSVYEKLEGQALLVSKYYNDRGQELSDGYTEADLSAYYEENAETLDTFEYSYLLIPAEAVDTKDENGNELDEDTVAELKEAAMEAAKAKAEEAQSKYEDGAEVADLIEEYEPSYSADHSSVVGSNKISSIYRDQVLEMGTEGTAIVEATNGYYLVILHNRYLDETPNADVRHILVRATNPDDSSTEPGNKAWTEAEEKINSILDEYKSGEQTEDAFAALANKYSDDVGSNTTGGLYEDIATTGKYVPEFLSWIFEDGRQVGDVGIIRHEDANSNGYNGYHLMYFVGNDHDPEWKPTARNAMASSAMSDWLDELKAGYTAALADGAKYLGA